jgi:hypothetical protein
MAFVEETTDPPPLDLWTLGDEHDDEEEDEGAVIKPLIISVLFSLSLVPFAAVVAVLPLSMRRLSLLDEDGLVLDDIE